MRVGSTKLRCRIPSTVMSTALTMTKSIKNAREVKTLKQAMMSLDEKRRGVQESLSGCNSCQAKIFTELFA